MKLRQDMISRRRGRAVLTMKKSNIIKPVEVEHVTPTATKDQRLVSEPQAEIDSCRATPENQLYTERNRKDTQPDDEVEIQTA